MDEDDYFKKAIFAKETVILTQLAKALADLRN